jgi:hypothetical protein
MSRYERQILDNTKPLLVRKPFRANGRPFEVGAPFDWSRMVITERRVRQLFDAGFIHHREEKKVAPKKVETKKVEAKKADTKKVEVKDK